MHGNGKSFMNGDFNGTIIYNWGNFKLQRLIPVKITYIANLTMTIPEFTKIRKIITT